jgi:uncharacterized protein (DUF2461 family)
VVSVPGSQSGLYVSIAAQGLHAGSGYWQMARDQLKRYRDAVQGPDGPALDAAVRAMQAEGIRFWGDALNSSPRGVDRAHPLIHLLRMKDLLGSDELGAAEALEGRRPVAFARSVWDRTRAVMGWMDAHVGASALPPEQRGRRR